MHDDGCNNLSLLITCASPPLPSIREGGGREGHIALGTALVECVMPSKVCHKTSPILAALRSALAPIHRFCHLSALLFLTSLLSTVHALCVYVYVWMCDFSLRDASLMNGTGVLYGTCK